MARLLFQVGGLLFMVWLIVPSVGWDLGRPRDLAYATFFAVGITSAIWQIVKEAYHLTATSADLKLDHHALPAAIRVPLLSRKPVGVLGVCVAGACLMLLPEIGTEIVDGRRLPPMPWWLILGAVIVAVGVGMIRQFPLRSPSCAITEAGVDYARGRLRFHAEWADIVTIEQRPAEVHRGPAILIQAVNNGMVRHLRLDVTEVKADAFTLLELLLRLRDDPGLRMRIGSAHSVDDLLEMPAHSAPPRPRAMDTGNDPSVQVQPVRRGHIPVITSIIVPVLLVGAYFACWKVFSRDDTLTSDGAPAATGPQYAMGATEFASLVVELKATRGTSEAVWVDLYADYAILLVPEHAGSPREVGYLWQDQELAPATASDDTVTQAAFDLAKVDAELVTSLCDRARETSAGAAGCALNIARAESGPDRGQVHYRTSLMDRRGILIGGVVYDQAGDEIVRTP